MRLFHVHFQEVGSTSEAYTWIIGDALVTIIIVSGTSGNSHFALQLCFCVNIIINLISGVTDTKGSSHTYIKDGKKWTNFRFGPKLDSQHFYVKIGVCVKVA